MRGGRGFGNLEGGAVSFLIRIDVFGKWVVGEGGEGPRGDG